MDVVGAVRILLPRSRPTPRPQGRRLGPVTLLQATTTDQANDGMYHRLSVIDSSYSAESRCAQHVISMRLLAHHGHAPFREPSISDMTLSQIAARHTQCLLPLLSRPKTT